MALAAHIASVARMDLIAARRALVAHRLRLAD